uniref:Uncharacterized protein n=1 Tax=Chromera velia CCMP2878 TaxID=1169474 RepID=A0A0G4HKX8_9ALVE|eukprot:Cvel_7297.t1-p1 / transcript=Cvel_7297.t1 / gene=Cvel_7297 / organism=Chromera_velia_CCMP2878 / gene_product=hypothetical protein / transcript_product=hypothetical protein / location=Cvel_scaffold377:69757-71196(+) / protein_length=480 / sequence_SO=supercontig / SO=protein_coding / is_pseudo=false
MSPPPRRRDAPLLGGTRAVHHLPWPPFTPCHLAEQGQIEADLRASGGSSASNSAVHAKVEGSQKAAEDPEGMLEGGSGELFPHGAVDTSRHSVGLQPEDADESKQERRQDGGKSVEIEGTGGGEEEEEDEEEEQSKACCCCCRPPRPLRSLPRGPSCWYGEDEYKWSWRNFAENRRIKLWVAVFLLVLTFVTGVWIPALRLANIDRAVENIKIQTIPGRGIRIPFTLLQVAILSGNVVGLFACGYSPRNPKFSLRFRPLLMVTIFAMIGNFMAPVASLIVAYGTMFLTQVPLFCTYSFFAFPNLPIRGRVTHICRSLFIVFDWSADAVLAITIADIRSNQMVFRVFGMLILVASICLDWPWLLYSLEHNEIRAAARNPKVSPLFWAHAVGEPVVTVLQWVASPVARGRETEWWEVLLLCFSTLFTVLSSIDKVLLVRGIDVHPVIEKKAKTGLKSLRNLTFKDLKQESAGKRDVEGVEEE